MNRHQSSLRAGAALLAAALVLVSIAGCRTTSPSGSKVAATQTVEGYTLSQIRMAAITVFQGRGWQVKSAFERDLIFERPGSTADAITFGGWMDPGVWLRVKLRIEELRPDVNSLDCNIYRVQNRGDTTFEEEALAYERSAKPLREILTQIKAKLAGQSVATPGVPPK